MSSSNSNQAMRQWMYARIDPNTNQVSNSFTEGLKSFMAIAKNHVLFAQKQKIFCPCIKCENRKFLDEQTVAGHLYNRGFMANYLVWVAHGENYGVDDHQQHAQENTNTPIDVSMEAQNSYVEMISDAFNDHTSSHISIEEDPNEEAKKFFSLLNASQNPIYDRCREGHSQLSLAARCMTLKTDYNLSEKCMDYIAQMLKDYMPADNTATASYYDTKKLMRSLGLPYKKIDVCQSNCMIFWKNDADLESCKFCGAARFKSAKPGRKKVPFRQMFYLPIADRLKRLYQSKKTASHMRWHKEHYSTQAGNVMSHPSDGEAWKHFNQLYPDFANESRNVYLGLCTDGFNPFGMSGQNYSLWPVILTPYNLPPDMCMKHEFMFLTILIPGPNHPKRSLDVFLQPLIEELNGLWTDGVESYDVSLKQNFTLRAMLLWTISDFPAYAMLSGWTTHGRLACPYCMDDTEAFWLKHGRKTCWFDCHRRFLPKDHSLRRNKKNFRKNKVVDSDPPTIYSGEALWTDHVMGLPKTANCGGEGHPKIAGYGEKHNWHKQSIFWELPYWKHLLLRHNLDVMHIEKNFFDNIINTLLNVQGKTKDNVKSRLDLADICNRKDLHMTNEGKAPVPLFRLSPESKTCLFNWLKKDVKFSDGYSSNLSSSVDFNGGKLSGMKSHDCHVFMQRLLPIAFAELLPSNIHQALSGISLFFRDLCARTLDRDSVEILASNIAIIMCNLEKIFPPSFFDVMEHLSVHLPHEAKLGGPVQFRWMYPFERYMYHLKKKAKNKAKIEGSIVEQYVNEEISDFCSYYFEANIQTKSRNDSRNDDGGGVHNNLFPDISEIFLQGGRGSGKALNVWLDSKDYQRAHSYVLLNCSYLQPFEKLFEEDIKKTHPTTNEAQLFDLKERQFGSWLKKHIGVDTNHSIYPLWLHDLVHGPATKVTSWPIYFCRGYNFHTLDHGKERWWFTFKSKFFWNHLIESEVRKMFCKCAATKLIDMISRVKERGKQPYWILDDYYKDLVAYWGTDKAKERSKKASKSRMSDRNGLGPHKHRAGSRSYARVADILKEKNGDASYIDVLRETHKKPDGSFVDERARLISEGFEKDVADHMLEDDILSTEELTAEQKNQMYLKLVDSAQGRVFGLGALLSEVSLNAKMPVTIESQLENDEFKKKVEDISQENEDIKETLSKLEGLEKMIAILCPAILSMGGNNQV